MEDYTKQVDRTVLLEDTLMEAMEELIKGNKSSSVKRAVLDMLQYINGEEVINHDNQNILAVLPYLLKLQNTKERQYGRSWCKHGDISAFFNIERKYDRISNIMERAIQLGVEEVLSSQDSSTPTETIIDTIADNGLYSLMWVGLRREINPKQFEQFLKQNELE
jgi:hypothetical protein